VAGQDRRSSDGKRFSFIADLESADGSLTKDALITNGFVEKDVAAVFMRPGTTLYKAALNTSGQAILTGTGTGTNSMWVVEGGKLYSGVA